MNRRGFLRLAALGAAVPVAGCLDFGQYRSGGREDLPAVYSSRMAEVEEGIRQNIVDYDAGFAEDIFDEESIQFDYKMYSENPASFVLEVAVDTAEGGPYEDLNEYLVGGMDDAVREEVAPVFGQMLSPVVKSLVPDYTTEGWGDDGLYRTNLTVGNPRNAARMELELGGEELTELNPGAGPDELYDAVKDDVGTVIVSMPNPAEPEFPGGI